MSQTSIPPSPTPTAENELGESHRPSPMLELFVSEEPTVSGRLHVEKERDAYKDRVDAAKKQISMFEQRTSKQQ